MGLGLTLFVTLALTDRTICTELRSGIPDRAPAFYFLDIRNDEMQAFLDSGPAGARRDAHRDGADAARPDRQGEGYRGRQGQARRPTPPGPCAAIAASPMPKRCPRARSLSPANGGRKDYQGPPLVSFVDEVAEGLGLKIGDDVTVNVLGRDVTAKIANLQRA